jgi:hypothetical protein
MMVNVSRFQDVQFRVADEIRARVDVLKRAIKAKSMMPSADRDPALAGLRRAFEAEYSRLGFAWDEVLPALQSTLVTEVKIINGRSKDNLDYSTGSSRYIAVGGLSLSRGLTLEGLTTSYFLRNSQMYDTLMQMGRWFGYRRDYEDLVRIWLTEGSKGWYEHITNVVEELRDDLRTMERIGGTPMDFGLKVLRHPDTLAITARNKMGSSESYTHSVSLSNRTIESHEVAANRSTCNENLIHSLDFVRQLGEFEHEQVTGSPPGAGRLFRGIPKSVILQFLARYTPPESVNPAHDPQNLRRFLLDSEDPTLNDWIVFIPFGIGKAIEASPLKKHRSLQRSVTRVEPGKISLSTKQKVSDPGIEAAGLTQQAINLVRHRFQEDDDGKTRPSGKKRTVPGKLYRSKRKNPLLMLFFVDPKFSHKGEEEPGGLGLLTSFGLSFPPSVATGESVEYQVNRTYLEQMRLFADLDEPDDEYEEEE